LVVTLLVENWISKNKDDWSTFLICKGNRVP